MRSLSRSDAQSTWRICRRAVQVTSLIMLAAACDTSSGAARPMQQRTPVDDSSSDDSSWTVTRKHAPAAADSGTPVHDAGQPPPSDPKPAADSGTPAQDAGGDLPVVEPTASIVLSSTPVTGEGAAPTATSFSISSVSELYVYTAWMNLCGEHTEIRKYYEPSGALFYQKLTAFSTDITEPVPYLRKPSLPHNTSVVPVIPNAQGALVMDDYIGVAGTWISDHSMTGTWKLELYLDNNETPSATRTFELIP